MATHMTNGSGSGPRPAASHEELLLRETHHRCNNDLQLIVGLLSMQSRTATNPAVREALSDATSRISVLARARSEMTQQRQATLERALRQVCEALHSQAEPRSILVSMTVKDDVPTFTSEQISTLALVVNELATNAIKHAFEEGKSGKVSIAVQQYCEHGALIIVDDDGLPFPEPSNSKDGGMGLGLVKRLVASVDGVLISPPKGSKCFEIRVPVHAA